MTEQEYLDVSDLARIRTARQVLRDICPETSQVVDRERYREIHRVLQLWDAALTSGIDVAEIAPPPSIKRSCRCGVVVQPHEMIGREDVAGRVECIECRGRRYATAGEPDPWTPYEFPTASETG